MVNLSVLSNFSLYFLLKHFTSSGNSNNKPPVHSNCQTAQVLFIQSNNQFLFKKCFFFFFFVVNISILRHFSLYFLLKHFTSSGNSNNKPPMHSNSPGSIHTIKQSIFILEKFFSFFFVNISLISNFSLYVTQIMSPQCTRIVTQPRVPSHCYYICVTHTKTINLN